jgi:hypothetical protein
MDINIQKNEVELLSYPIPKKKKKVLKMIYRPTKLTAKNIRSLEENIGLNLNVFDLGKASLDINTKSTNGNK